MAVIHRFLSICRLQSCLHYSFRVRQLANLAGEIDHALDDAFWWAPSAQLEAIAITPDAICVLESLLSTSVILYAHSRSSPAFVDMMKLLWTLLGLFVASVLCQNATRQEDLARALALLQMMPECSVGYRANINISVQYS